VLGNEYYVYRLIDPRTKHTFYVGKGKGERVYAHVRAALKDYNGVDYRNIEIDGEKENDDTTKMSLIKEILEEGLDVEIIIHRRDLDEKTAYEVEAALIDAYPGLTNYQKGHGNSQRGATLLKNNIFHTDRKVKKQINEKPIVKQSINNTQDKLSEIQDKCIIIKIKGLSPSIYDRVRRCWFNFNKKAKAEQAEYVLAVCHGRIEGVYEPTKWYYTCNDNECKKEKCEKYPCQRIGFIGHEADLKIQKKYLHKYIPEHFMGPGPGPFRYVNI
jgi:hypothetical protein